MSGQGVPIRNKKETVLLVLEANPVLQGSVIMAYMEATGGAHPREDSVPFSRCTHQLCSFASPALPIPQSASLNRGAGHSAIITDSIFQTFLVFAFAFYKP